MIAPLLRPARLPARPRGAGGLDRRRLLRSGRDLVRRARPDRLGERPRARPVRARLRAGRVLPRGRRLGRPARPAAGHGRLARRPLREPGAPRRPARLGARGALAADRAPVRARLGDRVLPPCRERADASARPAGAAAARECAHVDDAQHRRDPRAARRRRPRRDSRRGLGAARRRRHLRDGGDPAPAAPSARCAAAGPGVVLARTRRRLGRGSARGPGSGRGSSTSPCSSSSSSRR